MLLSQKGKFRPQDLSKSGENEILLHGEGIEGNRLNQYGIEVLSTSISPKDLKNKSMWFKFIFLLFLR